MKNIFDFLHFSNPTDEQRSVLTEMQAFVAEDNAADFLILCGATETGKISLTSALIGYLNAISMPYKIAAPTGRAARILGRKAKPTASTIHAMIYATKSDGDPGKVTFKSKDGHNARWCCENKIN